MKVILTNAFSLSMLSGSALVRFIEVSEDKVKEMLSNSEFQSAIGHESTANFLSKRLGVKVPMNRAFIKLDKDTVLIVAQLLKRLPAGKELSEAELQSIPMKYFIVFMVEPMNFSGCPLVGASQSVQEFLYRFSIQSDIYL